MKRFFSLLAVVALICALAVPASAAETDDGTWVELLETGFVNGGSHNYFDYVSTKTISINTPSNMRICKVDILFTYSVGTLPSKVEFYNLNGWASLTVKEIGPGLARAYGTVRSTFYSNVQLRFTRSATTTTYCELLSCRVSRISTQDFVADADIYVDGLGSFAVGEHVNEVDLDEHYPEELLLRVNVYDWQKFDTLTIWGSMKDASINSIRATIGTLGVPFEVSYMDMENSGEWMHAVSSHYDSINSTSTDASITNWYGKTLFCITIDLRGIDRTKPDSLLVYFTGDFDSWTGWTFNCQYVNGSIIVPDTSEATWWSRFTKFMSGLFGSEKEDDADDYAGTMESQSQQMQDAVDQMDSVSRPAVDQIDVSVDSYVDPSSMSAAGDIIGAFMGNQLIMSMIMISMTLALASFVIFGRK